MNQHQEKLWRLVRHVGSHNEGVTNRGRDDGGGRLVRVRVSLVHTWNGTEPVGSAAQLDIVVLPEPACTASSTVVKMYSPVGEGVLSTVPCTTVGRWRGPRTLNVRPLDCKLTDLDYDRRARVLRRIRGQKCRLHLPQDGLVMSLEGGIYTCRTEEHYEALRRRYNRSVHDGRAVVLLVKCGLPLAVVRHCVMAMLAFPK